MHDPQHNATFTGVHAMLGVFACGCKQDAGSGKFADNFSANLLF